MSVIKIRRGNNADLPSGGSEEGEPRFSTDTGQLYIDDGTNNVEVTPNATNVAAAGAVMTSGAQTIAGVKTFSDNIDMGGGSFSGGAATKGVINDVQSIQINWDYTQTIEPSSPTVGTAVYVNWDAVINSTGIVGASAQSTSFGPVPVFANDGVVRYNKNSTPYSFSPIGFGQTLFVGNTAGNNMNIAAGWGFMDANVYFADGAKVTAQQIDTMDGAASFVDSRIFGTTDEGEWDGVTGEVEHVGFNSQTHIVGNANLFRRVAFDVMDVNSTSPTTSESVENAITSRLGVTADEGDGTLEEQVGLRIQHLDFADVNIGIENASTTVYKPMTVNIDSDSDTIPITASVVYLVANNAYILTATPILAPGVDGQEIELVNMSTTASRTIALRGETNSGGAEAVADTGIDRGFMLGRFGRATLSYDAGAGIWRVKELRDNLIDLVNGTVNIYGAVNERYPKTGFGSFFGVPYMAMGAGGASNFDTAILRTAAGVVSVSDGLNFNATATLAIGRARLKNLTENPTTAAVVGDMVCVNGVIKVCTVAGTPGTWTVVGSQS